MTELTAGAVGTFPQLFQLCAHVSASVLWARPPGRWKNTWTAVHLQGVALLLHATVSLSSGYHPQSNGQMECTNQSLESTLRCIGAPSHGMELLVIEGGVRTQFPGVNISGMSLYGIAKLAAAAHQEVEACPPANGYGGRYVQPSYAPLSRPRGRRTAVEPPHRFNNGDRGSGWPPGTFRSRLSPESWRHLSWDHL